MPSASNGAVKYGDSGLSSELHWHAERRATAATGEAGATRGERFEAFLKDVLTLEGESLNQVPAGVRNHLGH